MAAHDAGGQPGVVLPHDTDAVDVHAQQFGGSHLGGQLQRHVVTPAAVDVFHPVDLPGAQGGKAGAGGQHVILQPPLGNGFYGALQAAHGGHLGHHQAKVDGGPAHRRLIDQGVKTFGQRFHVQTAAADHILEESVQFLRVAGGGHIQHIVNFQGTPQGLGLPGLAQGEHTAVQRAHAGACDDGRMPVQLLQSAPDTDLVASLGAAAGQYQRAYGCGIWQGNIPPCKCNEYLSYIITSSTRDCYRKLH